MNLKQLFDDLIDDDTPVRIVLAEGLSESIVLDATIMTDVTYISVKDYFTYEVCEIGAEIDVDSDNETAVVVVKIVSPSNI